MKANGITFENYSSICNKLQINLRVYDMVDFGVPCDPPELFTEKLLKPIVNLLKKGEAVICHCLAGIGRSGTVAACLAL